MPNIEQLTEQAIEATNNIAKTTRLSSYTRIMGYATTVLLAGALLASTYLHYRTT